MSPRILLPYALALLAFSPTAHAQLARVSSTTPSGAARVAPVRSGPLEIVKLLPSDSASFDGFGNAISIDGDVMLVGSSTKQVNGNNYAGAAYVFRRHGRRWLEETRLTATLPEIHDNFGTSVAIQGDLAVIGAPDFPFSSFSGTGRVWVFRRVQGAWTIEAELTAIGAGWDSGFGRSVSLDGNTLLVGAFSAGGRGAFVFEHGPTGWTQTHSFPTPPNAGLFASDVAVVGDIALISDRYAQVGTQINAGVVHAYRRTGGSWTHEATLMDPVPQDNAYFGSSIDFDGSTAVIGASGDLELFTATYQGGAWLIGPRQKDPHPKYLSRFGAAVAVDGDLIVAGAHGWDFAADYAGGLAVYRNKGADHVLSGPFVPRDSQTDQGFGTAVALDGTTLAVSVGAATTTAAHGAVYVFDASDRNAGFHLDVSPIPLQVDEDLEIRVRGGQPNAPVQLYSSMAGLGVTYMPALFTALDLTSPMLVATDVTGGNGNANWSLGTTPAALAGVTLWYQAVQLGAKTDYVATTVVP